MLSLHKKKKSLHVGRGVGGKDATLFLLRLHMAPEEQPSRGEKAAGGEEEEEEQ